MAEKTERLQDHLAYPPRGLRADRAAAYLGMSPSTFLKLVAEKLMPEPVPVPGHSGLVVWDRLELDAAFDEFKRQGEEDTGRRKAINQILDRLEKE